MANRPWVTPGDIKEYSDYEDVRERAEHKLKFDIVRAENYVIQYTGSSFSDQSVPECVRTAVILLSEYYAHLNHRASAGTVRKEKFDNYSYTAEIREIEFADLDLDVLLAQYKNQSLSGG